MPVESTKGLTATGGKAAKSKERRWHRWSTADCFGCRFHPELRNWHSTSWPPVTKPCSVGMLQVFSLKRLLFYEIFSTCLVWSEGEASPYQSIDRIAKDRNNFVQFGS